MKELLSKWVMRRYLVLWNKHRDKPFEFEQALNALHKAIGDDKKIVGLFLSELRKAGWLHADFHPEDRRKRIYRLEPLKESLDEITAMVLSANKGGRSGSK